jgi:hypothetical protein
LQRGSHASWDNAVVAVFFYGSFISRDVLAEHDVIVDRYEVAHLDGYDIVIQPLANLTMSPSKRSQALGIPRAVTSHHLRTHLHPREITSTVSSKQRNGTPSRSGYLQRLELYRT